MAATDAQIIEYARAFYGGEMASRVAIVLATTDAFAQHVRRSFQREIRERGNQSGATVGDKP